MLLIPLIVLIFAGASIALSPDLTSQEELKRAGARVLATVDDPVRRAEVDETVVKILNKSNRFNRAYQDAVKKIRKQYQDHSSGAEEAFVVLREFETAWESAQMEMVDLQFKLREQLTEDEWNEIYGPPE